tara:strand:+ start:10228 stop:10659 length:432 start_codon:yes stop_codon:yes gene_type:complete
MAIKIQGQTVIDNNQNVSVTGTVTATNFILADGSSANGGATISVSDTAPSTANLEEGALWWNSSADDASLYILYIDPDSAAKQWVEASPTTTPLSLDAYDTSAEVDVKISNVTVDLSNYDTSAEVDTKISNAALSIASLPTLP